MSQRSIFCRFCGASGSHRYGKTRTGRQRFQCPHCNKTFTRRTNTTKSGSQLSDYQWKVAIRLFSTRAGMSAADLARFLDINRKTAQRLNRAFRSLTNDLIPKKLPGTSEWDEAVISRQWMLGGVSRATRKCLIQCIPNRRAITLVPLVEKHSDAEGMIMTDEWLGYHDIINRWSVCHAREFVRPEARFVHTNTQEGIWSHLKGLSRHTYRGFPVSSLSQFLAEFMFRYNLRDYDTRVSVLSALLTRKTNSLLV